MLKILRFTQPFNLIILLFTQFSIKYGLFEPFGIAVTLNWFGMLLLGLSSLCLLAGGNLLIALQENVKGFKESIDEKKAYTYFIVLNSIGVLIGFYLSNLIELPKILILFIGVSGLFYFYNISLYQYTLIKNLIIGILASLALLSVGIFDLLPAITDQNQASQKTVFLIVLDYSILAFMLISLREIIKDCIKMDKDHNQSLKTLPIVLGKERTAKLISILLLVPILAVVYYLYNYLFTNTTAVILFLFLIIAPLLFASIKSWTAESQKDFRFLSNLLRLILISAACTLLLYQFII